MLLEQELCCIFIRKYVNKKKYQLCTVFVYQWLHIDVSFASTFSLNKCGKKSKINTMTLWYKKHTIGTFMIAGIRYTLMQ